MPPRVTNNSIPAGNTSRNGHHKPGQSTPTGKSKVAALLQEQLGTPDIVDIGIEKYNNSPKDNTGSWSDLARQVDSIKWLVPGWIPYGMLTGVVAEPKAGKSAFVLGALVRPIITGCPWFNLHQGHAPSCVVWCDTERRAAVNLSRARAWGLPIASIKTPFADVLHSLDLEDADHVNRMMSVVCRYKAPLIIVDSFRGSHGGDENSSAIQTILQALGDVCERTGAACVVIHHSKKMEVGEDMTINAGRGSNAFLASIATQIIIDTPDIKTDVKNPWRRVQVMGNNLGVSPAPIGFRFASDGLEFGPSPERPKKATPTDGAQRAVVEAGAWLVGLLRDGPVLADDVLGAAKSLGLCEKTLRKAAKEVGASTRKTGGAGTRWVWEICKMPG